MGVKVATSELLLDALMEHQAVKAALMVDSRGYIIEKRGSAACLLEDVNRTVAKSPNPTAKPVENLYIIAAGEDFLIVVFDNRLQFEHVKEQVDGTLQEFGLEPDDAVDEDD